MNTKRQSRLRRTRAPRAHMKTLGVTRLCVHRTPNHIYAQIICDGRVLAAASSLEKGIRDQIKHGGNKTAATLVGRTVAERAIKAGVKSVAFDRSGFRYHGRVAALADAAREGGMEF